MGGPEQAKQLGEAIGQLTWYAALLGTGVVGVTKVSLKAGAKALHAPQKAMGITKNTAKKAAIIANIEIQSTKNMA